MADQEQSDFYIVFTKIHHVLQQQKTLITLSFEPAQVSNQLQTYESNLKVTMEFEFTSHQQKVGISKDHGKNYITVRPPLVGHLYSYFHNGCQLQCVVLLTCQHELEGFRLLTYWLSTDRTLTQFNRLPIFRMAPSKFSQ